jgi:hypothetical protein
MSFKKVMQGKNVFVIGSHDDVKNMFRPGFRYQLGSTIYTVAKDVTQDATSSMREVITSDGSVEVMPVEVIRKDLRDPGARILDPDPKYLSKTAVKPEEPKEVKTLVKKEVKKAKTNGKKRKKRSS